MKMLLHVAAIACLALCAAPVMAMSPPGHDVALAAATPAPAAVLEADAIAIQAVAAGARAGFHHHGPDHDRTAGQLLRPHRSGAFHLLTTFAD